MSEQDKDELIEAQKQVIGILFELVKRLQSNINLDSEYFQLAASRKTPQNQSRLAEIMSEREANAKIVGRLLEQLKT